jgi:hypothetical protein
MLRLSAEPPAAGPQPDKSVAAISTEISLFFISLPYSFAL